MEKAFSAISTAGSTCVTAPPPAGNLLGVEDCSLATSFYVDDFALTSG